jgi:hypothetical protein
MLVRPKGAPVTTAVSNPVSEYKTADELDGDVGFDVLMLPEETGFSPVAYQSIDHTLAEVVYGKDGEEEPAAQVTVRMAAGNENICGIYGIEDYGTELLRVWKSTWANITACSWHGIAMKTTHIRLRQQGWT